MRRHDNELRFDPGSDKGHVESYFLRANHPERAMAVWLKATIQRPHDGPKVAELWCIVFDGEKHRTWASRETVPFEAARFGEAPPVIEVAGASFLLDRRGHARGSLTGRTEDDGRCAWNLELAVPEGELAKPLSMLPADKLVDAPFPKSKLLTPMPWLVFNGTIDVWGETIEVVDWHGMQGHNWGQEHAWEYAWGQCHFLGADAQPMSTVEAFSGRIRIGGKVTPFISGMVIRRGDREYRFDRLVDLWRQDPHIDDLTWTLTMRGRDGTARLEMTATADDMVCLGYGNPDGRLSHCLNSKLAKVTLRVNPPDEPGFECQSMHGGALEFLRNEPDARFSVV